MNDIIPEDALKTLEERFGSRFVRHTVGEGASGVKDTVFTVYPQSVEEVESLAKLAASHSIPLVARGAGTAIYPGEPPRGRFRGQGGCWFEANVWWRRYPSSSESLRR
jgi:FAD/FMN-containing dehydrogenase